MRSIGIAVIISFLVTLSLFSQTVWKIDRTHSNIDFEVRYMMLSYVRGSFTEYEAMVVQGNDDFTDGKVEVNIKAASVNTRNGNRDNHLRSPDFFDAENYPHLTFVSRSFEKVGDNTYKLIGDLTIRDVTKPVELDVEFIGVVDDPRGFRRVGFSGTTTVNRNDYNVQWNRVLEAGGFVVGEEVRIRINAQFIEQEQV